MTDPKPNMIMKVLRDNPFSRHGSAIMDPGFMEEYPESHILLVNESDWNHWTDSLGKINLRFLNLGRDRDGNAMYAVEESNIQLSR